MNWIDIIPVPAEQLEELLHAAQMALSPADHPWITQEYIAMMSPSVAVRLIEEVYARRPPVMVEKRP